MVGLTNAGGGGSGSSSNYAYAQVTFPAGSTCTATNGSTTLTSPVTTGLYVFELPTPSSTPESWTFSCTDGTKTNSQSISLAGKYQTDILKLSYSRVPEGYQEVEYLQSSGTQYIKTLHSYIQYNEQVEIDFMMLNSATNRGLFGYSYGSGASNCRHGLGSTAGSGSFVYRFYQTANSSGTGTAELLIVDSTAVLNTKISAVINNSSHQIKENGSVITSSSSLMKYPASTIQNITANIPLFCLWDYTGSYQDNSCSTARIYEWKRTNTSNNTVIEDLIPCRKTSNNTLGMYDIVSGTFITNSGSGTFTAGPDV